MGDRQQQTSSWPRSSSTSPPRDGGLPLFAAVTFALAAAITLAAATIFFKDPQASERPNESSTEPDLLDEEESNTPAPRIARPDPVIPGIGPEITSLVITAQKRAKIWNPSAVITSLEAIVRDGRQLDSLTIEFGEAIGQPAPGAPVNAHRLVISTVGDKTASKEIDGESLRLGLADPNCPLEVAVRKLNETGVGKSGRLGVILANSEKHNRLVWLMSTSDGETFPLDADSCALLRR